MMDSDIRTPPSFWMFLDPIQAIDSAFTSASEKIETLGVGLLRFFFCERQKANQERGF